MEEVAWDRAVEQACAGEAVRDVEALTLDGLVKCAQGKLPKSKVFSLFTQLKRLSIANVGLSSLADFPSLPHLERLTLSDNRIWGGLEHLVYSRLKSLRELDLSNNKIQAVEDLKPLAQLKLESLDLYECPVTRSADYRAKVFGMMKSLRFLDKTDVTGNERPESDDEEEEEDVDDLNGEGVEVEGDEEGLEGDSKGAAVLEEDDQEGEEDEERDDEEGEEDEERDDEEGEEDEERDDEGDDNEEFEDEEEDVGGSYQEEVLAAASGREVVQRHGNNEHGSDEELEDEEDDNVEVQDIEESEEEEVADEDDEDAVVDEDEEEDDEEPVSGAHVSTEGELDVQENEDEEDENGELGEDEEDDEVGDDAVDNGEGEEAVGEEDDEEEEECGTNYLVQPIGEPEDDEGASDFEPGDGDEEDEDFEDEEDKEPVGLTHSRKRIREETGEKEDRSAKH